MKTLKTRKGGILILGFYGIIRQLLTCERKFINTSICVHIIGHHVITNLPFRQ